MAKASTMPDRDEVVGLALGKAAANGLDVKVVKEPMSGYDIGVFRCEDVPFAYRLAWAKSEDDPYTNFSLMIYHVRPRTHKIFIDRDFKEKV